MLAALLASVTAIDWAGAQADVPPSADATNRPVRLELFTSQGCSSCPAAETAIVAAAGWRRTAVAIRREGSRVQLSVGQTGDATAAGEVWLISFDRKQATTIRGGEDAGKRIVRPNVERSIHKLADWSNRPLDLDAALSGDERGERLALLVQARDRPVWAVAATD